jgi:hypothetical protein
MDQFPFGILDRFTKPLGIMTWGMMFNWESLVAVLKQLPEIRELYLMYLYELPATVPAISPFRGAQLQTLRIWDNNILTRRSKAFAQLLQLLPELRHLYVRQYDMISPENLAILPPHLRSLHIHPSPTKNELIWSLGICLLSPVMGERVVEQVMAYGLTWAEENLGTFDLTPLRAVCGEKGIVFSQTEYEVYCPEIQIFCKSAFY